MRFLTSFELVWRPEDVFSWSKKPWMLITRPLLVSADVIAYLELLNPSFHSEKAPPASKIPLWRPKNNFLILGPLRLVGSRLYLGVSRSLLSINHHPTFSPGLSCLGLIERNLDFFHLAKKTKWKNRKTQFCTIETGNISCSGGE